MRVAVAAYPLETITSFEAWADKQRRLLGEAKALGADLAVLPEYLPLELAGAQPADVREDFAASLDALQALFEPWQALHLELARSHPPVRFTGRTNCSSPASRRPAA